MKTGIPTPFPYTPTEYSYEVTWTDPTGIPHTGSLTLHLYENDMKANHVHLTAHPQWVQQDIWWLTDESFPVFTNEIRPLLAFDSNEDAEHYDQWIASMGQSPVVA